MGVESSEVWDVENRSGILHNFHLHDVRFRILDYAGEDPPKHLRGLKDTVYIPPNETARLLTEFNDYTDPRLPYMCHCHVLQHEDRGMLASSPSSSGGKRRIPHRPTGTGAAHQGHDE